MADADAEKFGEMGALGMVRTSFCQTGCGRTGFGQTSFGVLDLKARHGISEPEMPCLGVVGGHAEAMLGSGVEFIEKVGVDSDAGGDDEVTGAGLPFEILVLNVAQRYEIGRASRRERV